MNKQEPTYEELNASNKALLQTLGEQHLKIEELTNKIESSEANSRLSQTQSRICV